MTTSRLATGTQMRATEPDIPPQDFLLQPGWCQPVRQEFMENECEALPGVAYPGVRDNRSTINTKTRYDDDDEPPPPMIDINGLHTSALCYLY